MKSAPGRDSGCYAADPTGYDAPKAVGLEEIGRPRIEPATAHDQADWHEMTHNQLAKGRNSNGS